MSRKKSKSKYQSKPQPQPQKTSVLTTDGYSNVAARLGQGSNNLTETASYLPNRITRDFNLLNNLYRNHWVVKKIINTVAEDMMKNWITIQTSELDINNFKRFDRYVNGIKLKEQLLRGIKWSRLYGGSVGIMIFKGHENILDQPLDYDTIMPDSFRGLIILDRWQGINPSTELVDDIEDINYNTPVYYDIVANNVPATRVHHSRVIRFVSGDLPYLEELVENHWGVSEVEIIYDELVKRDNASSNISSLLFMANLRVIKSDGLVQRLATGNREDENRFYSTIQAMNEMMSSQSLQVLDKDDEFNQFQYTFSGINEIYESFMLDLAGAAEIPVTRLYGRSPAGMNATGESDMQMYYESISQKQNINLKPIIDKLLPILCLSIFGVIPEDLDFKFNPVRQPTIEELTNKARDGATSVTNVFTSGLISRKQGLEALKSLGDVWSFISDEDIANAEDTTESFDILSQLVGGESNEADPIVGSEETIREPIQDATY